MLFAFCVFLLAGPCVILAFSLLRKWHDRPWTEKAFRFSWLCWLWLLLTVMICVWSQDLTALSVGRFYPAVFLFAGLFFLIVSVFSDVPDRTKRTPAIVLAVLMVVSGLGLRLYRNRYDDARQSERLFDANSVM